MNGGSFDGLLVHYRFYSYVLQHSQKYRFFLINYFNNLSLEYFRWFRNSR